MRVEFKDSGGTKREVRIEVPASEVDEKLKTELANLQRELKMPGFRRGKVPTDLVRRKFARSVRREVAERIVRETFRDAMRTNGLKPVASPEISDLQYGDGRPLTYNATVEVWPETSLQSWRGLKVKKEVVAISDEHVANRLNALRELHRELVPVDRGAQKGDIVILDYDVFDVEDQPLEGKGVRNHLVEIGSDDLLDEFGDGLLGAKAGESRTVEVTFPEKGPHEDVAGKTIKFWVKLSTVKEKQLPELNDDFAKELGKFDRLEDVEKEIRGGLEQEAELDAERRAREALVDELISRNPFDVPESMVNNLLEAITADAQKQWRSSEPFDQEKARAALRPVALRQAKRFVVLREVAKEESLNVSAEDVDQRIRVLAFRVQQSPAEVRRKIESDGTLDQMAEDLLEEKILARLMETAEVERAERKDDGPGNKETTA